MKFLPTINDMFNDLFYDPFMNRSSIDTMRTDIVEKDNEYKLSMELPGYQKSDIKMELKDGYLKVEASRNSQNDTKDNDGHIIRRERYSGNCYRSFYVGDVSENDIKASFDNGELKISIPKNNVKQVEDKKYITIE